jgi:hypothetical protein
MDIEKAKRVKELVDEITKLSECNELINDKEWISSTHFSLNKHTGPNAHKVYFHPKYTPMFMEVVDQILSDLNNELSNL